jgi:hypothetical protein
MDCEQRLLRASREIVGRADETVVPLLGTRVFKLPLLLRPFVFETSVELCAVLASANPRSK